MFYTVQGDCDCTPSEAKRWGDDSEENVAVLKYIKRSRSTGHEVSNSCNELHHSCNELDHSYYTMLAFLHVQGQLMIHVRNA